MLHQALSLCSSLVDEDSRFEAAFFESVRVLVLRLTNTGVDKKDFSAGNERKNKRAFEAEYQKRRSYQSFLGY